MLLIRLMPGVPKRCRAQPREYVDYLVKQARPATVSSLALTSVRTVSRAA